MPPLCCAGASLSCTFGVAPSALIARGVVLTENKPAATIMSNMPIVNVPPFGMCSSLANPQVAAATAAALGVLTPMPCIPDTPAPWVPPSAIVLIAGQPALLQTARLMCTWGGVISVVNPGQVTVVAKG